MLLAAFLLPASAQASPLLSGYGGPGEGSQKILGAQLLGGAAGGSGTGGARPASPASSGAAGARTPGAVAKPSAATQPRAPAVAGRAPSIPAVAYPAVERGAGGGGLGPVSLSAQDVLYMGLALAALALAGALTWRLGRAAAGAGKTKEMRREHRLTG